MSESQKTKSKPVKVYLGMGSNLGDRKHNLCQALRFLSRNVNIECVSPIYDTAPMGNTDQSRFLNLVCGVTTSLTPLELLTLVKGIETEMGRTQGPPNSPRPIDIDILFYGEKVLETSRLVIPHHRLVDRAFVLVPLADIAPGLKHPISGQTIRELLKELNRDPQDVIRWQER